MRTPPAGRPLLVDRFVPKRIQIRLRSKRSTLEVYVQYARQDSNLQAYFLALRSLRASLRLELEAPQYARQDSNLQPSVPKTDALSN
jgi:hypothetical protein